MKVHLVSAIFDSPLRELALQETMETLLADGLARRGIEVSTGGHSVSSRWPSSDIVHMHHLANGCLRLALPTMQAVVFTRHATKSIPWHHRAVLENTYRRSDAVVALSDFEFSEIAKSSSPSRLVRIYNGTNSVHFPAVVRSRPAVGEPWRLLYVGQVIELKRVHQAVELLAVLEEFGIVARLDIISHRDTLRGDVEARARQLNVADRVTFMGPRSRPELGQAMGKAHALVLPSRTEALPTVVTEALFSGLPVLAYDVGGIREQLPTSTEPPLASHFAGYAAQAIDLTRRYEYWLQEYSRHRAAALERFSVERMVDEHVRLYEEVLAQ